MVDKEGQTGVNQKMAREHNMLKRVVLVLTAWAIVATTYSAYSSIWGIGSSLVTSIDHTVKVKRDGNSDDEKKDKKKNVIFMVSDGMGPASVNLARTFRQYKDDLKYDNLLTLDDYLVGALRTRSNSSYITDSAAAGTTFACGKKTTNGAVSVLPDGETACGTVLEAAKLKGYTTGLVVTTSITDATPATLSAHAAERDDQDFIAEQQIGKGKLGRVVDLMIGGGRCHFVPKDSSDDACRKDDRNLVEEAQEDGWTYFDDLEGFKKLNNGDDAQLPLLGLLAPEDLPYEIDRDDSKYPSLEDATKTALQALAKASKDSEQGFFVMIEGSRIDHAGHANDAAAQVHEVLAYDAAFKAAIEFAKESDTETIVISTSDHETGGLSVARSLEGQSQSEWHPEYFINATHSSEYLFEKLGDLDSDDDDDIRDFIKNDIIEKGLGITNYTDDEIENIFKQRKDSAVPIVNVTNVRSQTGWSSEGHSAVDVNLYGFSKNDDSYLLHGNKENVDIAHHFAKLLDLDLDAVTKKLEGIQVSSGNVKDDDE